eukprot:scaffold16197_cov98-Skeletonema_marinoi.AAC.2
MLVAVNYGLIYEYLLDTEMDGTSHDARLHRDIVGCVGRAFPRCGGLGCCLARMQDRINNSYAEEASPFSMRDARSDFWD